MFFILSYYLISFEIDFWLYTLGSLLNAFFTISLSLSSCLPLLPLLFSSFLSTLQKTQNLVTQKSSRIFVTYYTLLFTSSHWKNIRLSYHYLLPDFLFPYSLVMISLFWLNHLFHPTMETPFLCCLECTVTNKISHF